MCIATCCACVEDKRLFVKFSIQVWLIYLSVHSVLGSD